MTNDWKRKQRDEAEQQYRKAESRLREYMEKIAEEQPTGIDLELASAGLALLKSQLTLTAALLAASIKILSD